MKRSSAGGDTDIQFVGALIADPARCQMLLALDNGRALPAGHLAREAGVSAPTASAHLRKLTEGGFLTVEARGRYRYYRLAGPTVAHLIEAMQQLAPIGDIRSMRQGHRAEALRRARTDYDHIAGRLGVEIMNALVARGVLRPGFDDAPPVKQNSTVCWHRDADHILTDEGVGFLETFGITVPKQWRAVRSCADWSEQRHHVGGGLGRALQGRMMSLDWIRPIDDSRALRVTPEGEHGFESVFGVLPSTWLQPND